MFRACKPRVLLLAVALALTGCGPGGDAGLNFGATEIPPPPPPKAPEPPPPPPQLAAPVAPLAPATAFEARYAEPSEPQAPVRSASASAASIPPSRALPAPARSAGGALVTEVPGAALPANMRPSSAPAGVYQIAAGDVIDVSVFQAPNLNRSVEVDGAGNVVLPLVGAVPVAGRTVRMAESEIARRYNERYLQNPDVTIFVKDAVGQRVTVDGAVRKTGFIAARANTTLLNVIAESGGVTDTADESAVIVFRPTQHGRMAARFDVKAIRAGTMPDPPIYGGDTVIVDESGPKTAWKQFREVLPAVGMFRTLLF